MSSSSCWTDINTGPFQLHRVNCCGNGLNSYDLGSQLISPSQYDYMSTKSLSQKKCSPRRWFYTSTESNLYNHCVAPKSQESAFRDVLTTTYIYFFVSPIVSSLYNAKVFSTLTKCINFLWIFSFLEFVF